MIPIHYDNRSNLTSNVIEQQVKDLCLTRQLDTEYPKDHMGRPSTELEFVFYPNKIQGFVDNHIIMDIYNQWIHDKHPLGWMRVVDITKFRTKADCLRSLKHQRMSILRSFAEKAYHKLAHINVDIAGYPQDMLIIKNKKTGKVYDRIRLPPLSPRVSKEDNNIVKLHERILEGINKIQ